MEVGRKSIEIVSKFGVLLLNSSVVVGMDVESSLGTVAVWVTLIASVAFVSLKSTSLAAAFIVNVVAGVVELLAIGEVFCSILGVIVIVLSVISSVKTL